MKPKNCPYSVQRDLFRDQFDQILNLRHSFCILDDRGLVGIHEALQLWFIRNARAALRGQLPLLCGQPSERLHHVAQFGNPVSLDKAILRGDVPDALQPKGGLRC